MEHESTATIPRPAEAKSTSPATVLPLPRNVRSATLIVLQGHNAGSTIVLNQDDIVIGNEGARWLQITRDKHGFHAVSIDPAVLITRNGAPLPETPVQLEDGDAIGVDEFQFVFGQES